MPKLKDLIPPMGPRWGPVDPIELFESLPISPASDVTEIWRPQADALREWHAGREHADVLMKLNTGAGKTLIGLVAAQSLVNENHGHVAYACATNQLLEQTIAKGAEYGIATASYYQGRWRGDAFHRGTGPLVTNYHALLNGRSIFRREHLDAVIFDDAHTAHATMRSLFTLRVDRRRHPDLFGTLLGRVEPYFRQAGRSVILDDILNERDRSSVLFVPTFVSAAEAGRFADDFASADVEEDDEMTFAWAHIRENLADCAMLLDARGVEFSPPVPPVHRLRPFNDDVRRLYLSATLRADTDFCRTFGRYPDLIIEPGGRGGDTERMILPAAPDWTDLDAAGWARQTIGDSKAAIMVPSREAATTWEDIADVFQTEQGHERLQQFAQSEDERLVLVARYDGIDLPGDACRIMVVDGLPIGANLMERFHEYHLQSREISDAVVASRIVQMFGRISRGMSDYGAILLVGRLLLRWLGTPRNRALLPPVVRHQLELGDRLLQGYSNLSAARLVQLSLGRDPEWEELYAEHMAALPARNEEATAEGAARNLPLAEHSFVELLWDGQPLQAARALDRVRDVAFAQDRKLGAWLLHWTAHALSRAGQADEAMELYHDAAAVARELGRTPDAPVRRTGGDSTPDQAQAITTVVQSRESGAIEWIEAAVAALQPGSDASVTQKEEAVRTLGEALGFESSRPDKGTGGEGPDNLWVTPDGGLAFVIDLKTEKTGGYYDKDDVGRSHQHIRWVENRYPEAAQLRVLVGPRLPCSPQATPPDDVWIVSPEEFVHLGEALLSLYRRVLDQRLPLFREEDVRREIAERGLAWEDLADRFERTELGAAA